MDSDTAQGAWRLALYEEQLVGRAGGFEAPRSIVNDSE